MWTKQLVQQSSRSELVQSRVIKKFEQNFDVHERRFLGHLELERVCCPLSQSPKCVLCLNLANPFGTISLKYSQKSILLTPSALSEISSQSNFP